MFTKILRWLVLITVSITTIAFFAAAAPASATGISVSPKMGGFGTTFTVTAGGFPANSLVDTWYTRSDGQSVSTGTMKASSSGQVSFSITPASNWPAGEYIAVAHARSGFELSVKFSVNSPSSSGKAKTVSETNTTGISVSPKMGGFGTTFTITAGGFSGNALVDTWYTRPDGQSFTAGTMNANSSGQVSFSITPASNWPAGEYIAVARARGTGFQQFVKFSVNGTSTASNISISGTGIAVSPTSGGSGTTFTITAGGYEANALVDTWYTRSDNKTFAVGTIKANSSGQVTFTITPSSDWPSGEYIAVAHARATGFEQFVKFGFNAPPPPGSTGYPNWRGAYFNNQDLSGSPVLVRNDSAINFNWGSGSPDPSVQSNHFSVRWTKQQHFDAGTYQFTVTTDDGMRLWVGDNLLIDAWYDQSATHTATITLSAGTYPLKVEYYENQGVAVANVSWSTNLNQAWTGYYYSNMNLSGSPAMTRQDAQLNFNWGVSGPGGGIPGTNFSAKWDSTQYASNAGNYTFYVTTDDGVRVWLDGSLIIDKWFDQFPTQYTATRYLSAGPHAIHVEYYQHNGGATLQFNLVAN